VHKIKEAITAVDPEVFFYVQRIKEVGGGIVKRKKKSLIILYQTQTIHLVTIISCKSIPFLIFEPTKKVIL